MASLLETWGYRLTFQDDFDYLSLDTQGSGTATWSTHYVRWDTRTLAGNNEQQLYVDPDYTGIDTGTGTMAPLGLNPFQVANGTLTITASEVPEDLRPLIGGYHYVSGHLSTELSFAQQYGYFEMRAKMPEGQGLWPAFWLLPADGSWPPEIDVAEAIGSDPNTVLNAVHGSTDASREVSLLTDITQWHAYGLRWTEKELVWFIDGVETFRVANTVNQPMYLIANLAVGGDYPGSPDATTPFPAGFQIDYIRAYAEGSGTPPPPPPGPLPTPVPPELNLPKSGDATRWFTGTSGDDVMTGTPGNDFINGAAGIDTLIGGAGDDTYTVDRAEDRVVERAGEGVDTVSSWAKACTLADEVENLKLNGAYASTGTGNNRDNRLQGSEGDNRLDGGGGNDLLTGGAGNDAFVVTAGSGHDVIADFTGGAGTGDLVKLRGYAFPTFAEVVGAMTQHLNDVVLALGNGETLTFRNLAIDQFAADDFDLSGSSSTPAPVPVPPGVSLPESGKPTTWISGTDGGDSLNGTPGNDFINGAAGIDTLVGGAGDDSYVVDRPDDTVIEGPGGGVDTVASWSKTYGLAANVENLKLNGTFASAGTGNTLANRLLGNDGDNTLDGAQGNDVLTGGLGNDTFVVGRGNGSDVIADFTGGVGTSDVVRLQGYFLSSFEAVRQGMATVGADVVLALGGGETLTFRATTIDRFAADDFLFIDPAVLPIPAPFTLPDSEKPTRWTTGTEAGDVLAGTSGHDFLNGAAGADTLAGGDGDDTYVVDRAEDLVFEAVGAGIDTVSSWSKAFVLSDFVENLRLAGGYGASATGNTRHNRLEGNAGADTLSGLAGHDLLIGGGGSDKLWGGADGDLFVYRALSDGGDIIKDFKPGEDLLDLRPVLSCLGSALTGGFLTLTTDAAGSTQVWVDADGAVGSAGAVLMATLEGVSLTPPMVPSAFLWSPGT